MTDIKDEIKANIEELEKNPEIQKQNFSDFEQKMIDRGWDPKGDKSAEQWLDDGHNIRKKQVDTLYKTVDYLKNYVERQEKTAYEKALAKLKEEKREAIELSDVARVEHIEQQQNQLMNNEQIALIEDFKTRNADWLEGTSHQALKMAELCHKKDAELMSRNLGPQKHLEALENYMKGEFPSYFGEQEDIAPAVEGRQSTVVKNNKKTLTFDDLNDIQKQTARLLERKKVMSVQDYINDLKKTGDLK